MRSCFTGILNGLTCNNRIVVVNYTSRNDHHWWQRYGKIYDAYAGYDSINPSIRYDRMTNRGGRAEGASPAHCCAGDRHVVDVDIYSVRKREQREERQREREALLMSLQHSFDSSRRNGHWCVR